MAAAVIRTRGLPALLLVVCLVPALPGYAQATPPPAYQLAAQRAGVPSEILYAVALQESGISRNNRMIPWPWSLNVAGETRRYANRGTACAGLQRALRDVPPTRIDAGLGQINLGYQKRHYRHPCELLDPYRNLAIAAAILREQHRTGDDWLQTVGRYHRPAGGAPAARYRRRVAQYLDRMLGRNGPTSITFREAE